MRQRLLQVEDERRGIEDQTSNEWRENLQDEAWARHNLGFTLERQVSSTLLHFVAAHWCCLGPAC